MSQYATIQDLRDVGLPPEAIEGIDGRELVKLLQQAAGEMDSYLRSKHTLPIVGSLSDPTTGTNTFPGELIRCNVCLTSYDLLTRRGFQPDGADEHWRLRYEDCVGWLKQLASGSVLLDSAVDQTTGREGAPKLKVNYAGAINRSPNDKARGW